MGFTVAAFGGQAMVAEEYILIYLSLISAVPATEQISTVYLNFIFSNSIGLSYQAEVTRLPVSREYQHVDKPKRGSRKPKRVGNIKS